MRRSLCPHSGYILQEMNFATTAVLLRIFCFVFAEFSPQLRKLLPGLCTHFYRVVHLYTSLFEYFEPWAFLTFCLFYDFCTLASITRVGFVPPNDANYNVNNVFETLFYSFDLFFDSKPSIWSNFQVSSLFFWLIFGVKTFDLVKLPSIFTIL